MLACKLHDLRQVVTSSSRERSQKGSFADMTKRIMSHRIPVSPVLISAE